MKTLAEPLNGLSVLYGEHPRVGYRRKPPPKQPKAVHKVNGAKVARRAAKTSSPFDTGLPPRPKAASHMRKEGAVDMSKYRQPRKAATPKQRAARAASAPARNDGATVLSYEAAAHLANAHLGRGAPLRKRQRVPRRASPDYVAELRRAGLAGADARLVEAHERSRSAPTMRHAPRAVAAPSEATTRGIFWTVHDAQLRHNNPDHELRELRALMRAEARRAGAAKLDRGALRARGGGKGGRAVAANRFEAADAATHRLKLTVEQRFGSPATKARLRERRGAISLSTDHLDKDRRPVSDARRLSKRVALSPPTSYVRSNHLARQCCHHPADYKACAPAVRYRTRAYSSWEKQILRHSAIPTGLRDPATFDDARLLMHMPDPAKVTERLEEPPSEATFASPIKGNRLRDSTGIIDPETGEPAARFHGESCMPVGEIVPVGPRRRRGDVARGAGGLLTSDEVDYDDPAKTFGAFSSLNPANQPKGEMLTPGGGLYGGFV